MNCKSVLKFLIYSSIGLILAIAIVLEIIFITLANGKFAKASDNRTWLIGVGTTFFALFLVIVILGLCGICRRHTVYLIIYAAITAIIFIGLWIAFSYLKKGKQNIRDDFNDYCAGESPHNFIDKLARAYPENIETYFCSNACVCKADKGNFPTAGGYDDMRVDDVGASTVVNCPDNPVKNVKTTILSFIGWMEDKWSCSGLCRVHKYYYYSDVNKGQPVKACKGDMLDYVDKWYIGAYVLVIISAIFTFFGSISSLLYICCGGKEEEKYAKVQR
eukprot:TRINITY_DN15830_c0_g1_i12.p1 TRINITY_DN15830_c0_g1~~TRINITY_DN15830_c0_g1_i12.p1  ORF type:complete len:275 (+),score=76.83 TRINITY_DN15830_c0_g1_i12:64-888(+)